MWPGAADIRYRLLDSFLRMLRKVFYRNRKIRQRGVVLMKNDLLAIISNDCTEHRLMPDECGNGASEALPSGVWVIVVNIEVGRVM